MPVYDGVNGVVRKRKEWPVGINGVVRQQKEHWAGINGVKRQIFSSAKPAVVTLEDTQYMSWNPNYVYVVIDGVKYTSPQEVTTTVGAIMDCVLYASSYSNARVFINRVKQTIPQGTRPWHFLYQIPGNITVKPTSEGYPGGNTPVIDIFT